MVPWRTYRDVSETSKFNVFDKEAAEEGRRINKMCPGSSIISPDYFNTVKKSEKEKEQKRNLKLSADRPPLAQ